VIAAKRIIVALVFLGAAGVCLGQKQEAVQDKQSQYTSLLASIKSGDLTIDFQQLRFSYMDSPERHQAKDTSTQQKEMWQALNRKEFKKAVDAADVVLANEFVNLDAHFVESRAYAELQNAELSDFHNAVFYKLLKSITDSGDGKTAETAYVVISTHEEYVLLSVRGLKPGKQSLVHDGGHDYDLLEVNDAKTNETVKLYFNVDIPFKHYLQ
jgi:hypothetical protein